MRAKRTYRQLARKGWKRRKSSDIRLTVKLPRAHFLALEAMSRAMDEGGDKYKPHRPEDQASEALEVYVLTNFEDVTGVPFAEFTARLEGSGGRRGFVAAAPA